MMPEEICVNRKTIILINLLLVQALLVFGNISLTVMILSNFIQVPLIYVGRASLFVGSFTVLSSIVLVEEVLRMTKRERELGINTLRLEESRRMLDALNAQTHDFLNHIQVVYGMAQLGLRENLASYVNELVGGIEPESRLNKSAPLELAAFLIKKSSFVKTLGIKLDIEIEANLRGLRMPPPEMVRVVGNLVNNAVYSLVQSGQPDKRILVKLTEERDKYKILICDNGPGIPNDIKKQIFAKGFSTKGVDGSGLGLHITRSLVEKYEGEIGFTKQPGFNTCFAITFPNNPEGCPES